MTNPNNATITTVHTAEFTAGDALKIPTLRILRDDGSLYEGAVAPELDKATAIKMYDTMVFTRVLDERMLAAQRQGRISFYMQCLGEEATTVGSAAALAEQDMIMAQYREQGALRYRGFTLEQFMNQLFSNEKDLGKGRQMPVHYGSKDIYYMTISSPLGTQIPQASGYAYAQKLRGLPNTTICYFGEGAASEGDFHAGLNMAAVHKAPVIFFCRNNGYAISTPASEQFVGDGIACRAVGYGMKALRVDGADILAVYQATKMARDHALKHNEPVLIESIAYRLGAHSSSDDPSGYRSKEEEEKWRQNDPIARFRLWLVEKGWLNEADDKATIEALRTEILDALKVAEKVAKPGIEHLISDVYAEPIPALQQQLDELKAHIRNYPEAYPVTAGRLD
ncbi:MULTISPECIES: thiamine pyrophosphate-dependent dehydrogenase E1 component subunit alpha [Rheinheimera]|jgi:2-oxoisovalerate dehydrogenase E1 component alpha subunit|uniref:2-oxoisovalerate dehydrogenase subunit alpha n=1 Tax=Rheinheimera pacifica TaxID=173990 RepID=A0A1H6LJP5_9GAMM|nr:MULTISPECIES: thiamine pyrophosphate-dependent dehydrogenase E1 component subunit alpha [Rheinheimera]KUM53844.1 3-methyl-2-oxobutanoate dehydrogenase [Rheinheimera sp. EpRS3]SEH88785.1 2-oxoisovalerate dehydrogenase E1 component alpha subunit [Rheinheimera pacifica]